MNLSVKHEIESLFALALQNFDEESDAYWSIISKLQSSQDPQTLETAILFCKGYNYKMRCIGAAVLGQLGYANVDNKIFGTERFSTLIRLLSNEAKGSADVRVLANVCLALGHLRDSRAITEISKLANHYSDDVRLSVACSLSGFDDARAIQSLIELMDDPNSEVRDWATFAIGSLIKSNKPNILDALHTRISDENADVRNEAILGLALRGDERARGALALELTNQVATPLFEAVVAMPSVGLVPVLLAARRIGIPWPDHFEVLWEQAIAACRGTIIENDTGRHSG